MNNTQTPSHAFKDAPVVYEVYRRHQIGNKTKRHEMSNPISGHHWAEHQLLKTLSVSCPGYGWSSKSFKSVQAAKAEIDGQIRLNELVELAKQGLLP